jgi:hypothetical protein
MIFGNIRRARSIGSSREISVPKSNFCSTGHFFNSCYKKALPNGKAL